MFTNQTLSDIDSEIMDELLLKNINSGNIALRVANFEKQNPFADAIRTDLYSCILVTNGKGENNSDTIMYNFDAIQAFFYTPFQLHSFNPEEEFSGTVLQFHSDLFCLEKHAKEVGCNGVLFNNIYGKPFISISDDELLQLDKVLNEIKSEVAKNHFGSNELIVSYLKIFLINAVRFKLNRASNKVDKMSSPQNALLNAFEAALESNFKTDHNAGKYAVLLNVSLKTLNNCVQSVNQKTVTQTIQERLITEAKRELYLTEKSIKEISFELGFSDLQYFSRLFKKKTSLSPSSYRNQLGLFR